MITSDRSVGQPLYQRVLGSAFDALAPSVQALHRVDQSTTWIGTAEVMRGAHPLARLAASIFGMPSTGRAVPLAVTLTPDADGREIWERSFAGRRFRSVQSDAGAGIIAERVGLVTLLLRPDVERGALTLTLTGARFVGLPLPSVLWPIVATHESEVDGQYRFDVRSHLPLIGLLVHYQGSLTPKV